MINTVSSADNAKKVFDPVSNRSDMNYWLSNNSKDEVILSSAKKEKNRTKKLATIGLSIGGSIVASAGIIVFLLKGSPKGLTKFIQKLQNYYFNKLQQSKLNGEDISNGASFILSKLNSLAQKVEAGNNFTTMKDYAFKRFLNALGEPAAKIHQGITRVFEKLGRSTVKKSYEATAAKFLETKNLNKSLTEFLLKSNDLDKDIIINGVKHTKKEWIEILQKSTEHVENQYTAHFKHSRQVARYRQMHKFTQELEESFKQKGDFWFLSKDVFKDFVAEQKMLKNKTHLQIPLKDVKKKISYTANDLYNEANEGIMRISSLLGFGDKNSLSALNNLRTDLRRFSINNDMVNKEKLLEDVDKFIKEFLKSSDPKDRAKMGALNDILEIKNSIINYKQGEVENILDIYKTLLSNSQYGKIEKSYAKTIKSFNKSLNLETEEFVNKLRDLSMGSAPTDILTMLTGFGTLAYYLIKSDDNRERLGITLKYGIPALTLIGASLYGNAKLFAGTKSLAFGLASSWVFNRIGSAANDILQKYFDKKDSKRV